MRTYLLRVAIALDQFVQAACNRGVIGVTISARADTAREHGHRWGCLLCRWLDRLDPDHCAKARRNDIARAEAAIASLR